MHYQKAKMNKHSSAGHGTSNYEVLGVGVEK